MANRAVIIAGDFSTSIEMTEIALQLPASARAGVPFASHAGPVACTLLRFAGSPSAAEARRPGFPLRRDH